MQFSYTQLVIMGSNVLSQSFHKANADNTHAHTNSVLDYPRKKLYRIHPDFSRHVLTVDDEVDPVYNHVPLATNHNAQMKTS